MEPSGSFEDPNHPMINISRFIIRTFLQKHYKQFPVLAFLKSSNAVRLGNLIRNRYEFRRKRIDLNSFPFMLYLEPTNACNFRCPFCFTGKRLSSATGRMSLETVDKIVDQLGDYIYYVNFRGSGEPLLHPDLPEIIRRFNRKKIFTVVSTNASLLDEERAEALIRSELDYLIVSIDGATEKTYDRYRVGGRFSEVCENVRNFLSLRSKFKRAIPKVEWQYVVFKHNLAELPAARKMAEEMGVDYLEFMPGYVEEPEFAVTEGPYKSRFSTLSRRSECHALWSAASIKWNGDVGACCWDEFADSGFGNIGLQAYGAIRNSPRFRDSRRFIALGPEKSMAHSICDLCVANINKMGAAQAEFLQKSGNRSVEKAATP